MLFQVPNENQIEQCYKSLGEWLQVNHPEPFHKGFYQYNMKYLGHYIEGYANGNFIVSDLYCYKGTKFCDETYCSRWGDGEPDYTAKSKKRFDLIPNKELKKTPEGEAYRRSLGRKPCIGYLG